MLLFVWKVVSGRTADHTFFLVFPVLLRLADVGLVADLGHLLGLGEEFLSLVRISLLNREVTNLTEQEVVEVLPVGLLGVERERILAFLSQGGVVQIPNPIYL